MSDKPMVVVTLDNLAEGAAAELFQAELEKVLRNIADPNTDPTAIRRVTLTVGIQPDEDREVGEVAVKASSKLAGPNGARTRVYFGRHQGAFVASEFNPKQAGLFDETPAIREIRKGGR